MGKVEPSVPPLRLELRQCTLAVARDAWRPNATRRCSARGGGCASGRNERLIKK